MGWINDMGNMPMGCTENDPHFDLGSDEDSDEPEKCAVYECEKPQAPRDIYCPVHRAIADDMRRSYVDAKIAGWIEERL